MIAGESRRWRRRAAGPLLAGALALVLAGCNQKDEIKAQIARTAPEGLADVTWSVHSAAIKGTYNFDGQEVQVECNFTITGQVDGKPTTFTAHVVLKAKGSKGGSYELKCDDPLVIQFPSEAHAFSAAAISSGGTTTRLPVTSGLASLRTAPGRLLSAARHQQLVVISFPPGLRPGTYRLHLTFDLRTSHPIAVKPMIAGAVTCATGSFTPLLLPAVSDIGKVPADTIPLAGTPFTFNIVVQKPTTLLVNCAR